MDTWVANTAAVTMALQIALQDPVFNSFEYIPRSRIDKAYSKFICNTLRSCHILFSKGAVLFYIPAAFKGSTFSTSLLILVF
jgi:hypothetical protein